MFSKKFADFMTNLADQGENLFNRVKDKTLFKRVVSGAFLIAIADGDFDSDEKSALARIINRKLPQFEIADILAILKDCEEALAFDATLGKSEILDDIGKANTGDGQMIVQIACFIGAADGDFDDDEKAVTREMCQRLKLSPADYGL